MPESSIAQHLGRAAVLFVRSAFVGLILLPLAIYWVGRYSFGPYPQDGGLIVFFGHIYSDVQGGKPLAWLLVLAPWLLLQTTRLTAHAVRRSRATNQPPPTPEAHAETP